MAALALLVGLILVVSAIRDTQGSLFSALGTDVPAFFVWGAAVVAIVVIGYVPGLKTVSRGLLALVVVVLILHNYRQIIAGFQGATSGAAQGSGSGMQTTSGLPSVDLSTLTSLVSSAGSSSSSFGSAA